MRNVVIGFLGTTLDAGRKRHWKPSPSLVSHPDFPVDRFEMLYDHHFNRLALAVKHEIEAISPQTEVVLHRLDLVDPWDFEEVYAKLFDFARGYGFDEDREQYHIHLTTGTHVAQICWFLLAESRHVPAQLVQTGPPRGNDATPKLDVIDLDLRRYNALQHRFDLISQEYSDLLKGGIATKNAAYNGLISQIEHVAGATRAPILLLGETGTGKTQLAERIHSLKLDRRMIKGRMVHVNCATLAGPDGIAMLFGQRRGYTGQAGSERNGLLREADGGVLFLDEIDELGLREQAVILHAIETGRYYPLGSDYEVTSRFHVIAGSNHDLRKRAAEGLFRQDLLSRLTAWTFELPPLRHRREDIEPNLMFELARAEKELGMRYGFNLDARERYLKFARDPATPWSGNFRDFGASVRRMCIFAARGRITRAMVEEEILRLRALWSEATADADQTLLHPLLGRQAEAIDLFDRAQLAQVIRSCRQSASLSEAGRTLFSQSRNRRTSTNDADRLRKYLAKYGLDWDAAHGL
ncbi:RNA repair transcriptional activator RtcR [Celeribacter baekdonensis]|uniref:Transcriptional regulator n=1 Tax=Celeribacter baekdonensis TaxID=875171 RepID=A0A2R4M1R3_9RHOB|nr:RNA repair transcriptional activator RtcR [Celeribacter baekdonensis]AVW91140.1 transcriptional regulator [Celeribacter baekdonensis]|tara:strand:- start:9681 stop:11252 length:1572 start_codon:yes stop_codon:yes gene_type:complete